MSDETQVLVVDVPSGSLEQAARREYVSAKTYDPSTVRISFAGRAVTGFNVPDDKALVGEHEASSTPDPTEPYRPMNRHARRKAAALARKGGGR